MFLLEIILIFLRETDSVLFLMDGKAVSSCTLFKSIIHEKNHNNKLSVMV